MLSSKLTRFKNIPVEVKASLAYTICSILQNCLAFITLPLFTRLLTTEQYGLYTVYISWSTILIIFVTLNLPYGSFQTAMTKFEDRRDLYISSCEGICLLLAAVFMVIYLPFRQFWNSLLKLPTILMIVMVFEMLGNTAILFWSGKQRFEFKYKSVVAVTLFNAIVAPIVTYFWVINTTQRGYARIIGYAMVTIIVGGAIFILNIVRGKKLFHKEFWKYVLEFNLPLLCYYLSQVIFNQSDRIMIDNYCGKDKAAMYGVAYTLAIVLTFVLNAINGSFVPWFYGRLKDNSQDGIKSITTIIAVLMSVLLSGVIWLAPEIIAIMAGKQYTPAVWVVPPVAVSLLLLYYSQLFINVEFYYEKKGHLVYASIASAVINIVLNAVFIPQFGFVAAGYTTLFSYIIFAICNYIAMKAILKEKQLPYIDYNYKALVGIAVVFALLSAIAVALYSLPLLRYGIIATILIVVVIKRKLLMKYVMMLRGM